MADDAEFQPRQRDRALKFHRHTIDADLIYSLGVSPDKNWKRNAALNSLLTEAALYSAEGKRVSYSRRREYYVDVRRYHNVLITWTSSTNEIYFCSLRASNAGWSAA